MSNHSGFAAVAQVRDTAINSTLVIFHRSGLIPTNLSNSRSFSNPFGPGQVSVNLNLFLDAPHLVFEEARGAVLARFVLAGTVTLEATGTPDKERQVRFDIEVVFIPAPQASANGVSIQLLAAGASLQAFSARNVGDPIPSRVMDFLNGNDVRAQVAGLVIAAAAALNSISPPLLVPFVDSIGVGTLVNISRVQAKVLDGALAVAVDFSPGDASFQTNGDLGDVESFLSVSDLAICAHPSVRSLLARMALPAARAQAAEHDVEIDSLSIALAENHLKVIVHATKDDFGAKVTLRAIVHIGQPEVVEEYEDEYGGQYTQVTPGTDDIWVEIWDIQVDTELPWWIYLLITVGVFVLLPLGPVIVSTIVAVVDTIKANVANKIDAPETGASRVQRVTLPGTVEPFVDFTVSQIKTSPGGFQTRAWFRPVPIQDAGKVIGPKTSTVEELADGDLSYTFIADPSLWHPQNPLIEVRWQVRRLDTNEMVVTRRLPLADPEALSFSVNLGSQNNIGSPKYKINCSVFRKGSPNELLASDTVELEVKDRLDRSHPFVQWDHNVFVPRVERVKGILRLIGWDSVYRSSKIHKTKLPGRCRMAGQYSPLTWPISLHYYDSLPFPEDQLVARRNQLCDYCFFGGPDKAEPFPL